MRYIVFLAISTQSNKLIHSLFKTGCWFEDQSRSFPKSVTSFDKNIDDGIFKPRIGQPDHLIGMNASNTSPHASKEMEEGNADLKLHRMSSRARRFPPQLQSR